MALFVFDALVRHQLLVEGLKANRANRVDAMMRKINEDVRRVLGLWAYDELGSMNKTKLQLLVRTLREAMRTNLDPYVAEMVRWFEFYMKEEEETFTTIYNEFEEVSEGGPILWPIIWGTPIAANGVRSLLFLQTNANVATVKVEQLANKAYVNNWTKSELLRAIVGTPSLNNKDGELSKIAQATRAVSNTITQHIASQTNAHIAERTFSEYEWVSILDERTTSICRGRDGKRWRYGFGPLPPAHVNCRSDIMPVVAGQPVPPQTLGEWLRTQPARVRALATVQPLTLEQFRANRNLILTE